MSLKAGLTLLLSVVLLISNVNSGRGSTNLKGLGDPNQPTLITIETEHGDMYDCVDFYKQPAFDHPQLKNHDFHPKMRPISRPKHPARRHQTDAKLIGFGLNGECCPTGTVPIRRSSDQSDSIRAETLKKYNHSSATKTQPNKLLPGHENAVVQSKWAQVYYGVGANLTVHAVPLENHESSSGLISITGYPDTIQAGWTVNPILYDDDFNIRMFIYTDKVGGRSCHNTDCPGFVLVRADIPVDSILTPYYENRGPNSFVRFFIYQDAANGNWWLEMGPDFTPIGFWPRQIFNATGLAASGSYIACGGEVYHPNPKVADTPMGSGFLPSKDEKGNAYCYNLIMVNKDHKTSSRDNTEPSSSWPSMYKVRDVYVRGHVAQEFDAAAGDNLTEAENNNIPNGSNIDLEHQAIYGGPEEYS